MAWTTLQMEDSAGTPRAFNVFQKADGSFIFGKREVKGDLEGSNWAYAAAAGGIVNTTTAVTLIAAPGAGLVAYITSMQVSWDGLAGVPELVVRSGAGGTVIWRMMLYGTGWINVDFTTPLAASVNNLLEAATLTADAGRVYINAQGFVA